MSAAARKQGGEIVRHPRLKKKSGNFGKPARTFPCVHACTKRRSGNSFRCPAGIAGLRMINRANPLRVLLVDDENYMRVFVGRVVTTSISSVISEARDGQDAIDQCQTVDPELIILDINMP